MEPLKEPKQQALAVTSVSAGAPLKAQLWFYNQGKNHWTPYGATRAFFFSCEELSGEIRMIL